MEACIVTGVLGVLLAVLGSINMTGNISSLHWYHRQRVSEENRKPFGRCVGLGTLLIGFSLGGFAVLYGFFLATQVKVLITVAVIELVTLVIVGLGISLWAMIKYNKGIF